MILLDVPFAEKDQAKALGARWNPQAKKWYIPDELESEQAQFSRWLPDNLTQELGRAGETPNTPAPAQAASTPDLFQSQQPVGLMEEEKGIRLSQLMHRAQAALRQQMGGAIWVKAEIANINERRGHYYLELVETNDVGQQLASTRAMIWASQAHPLLQRFEQETGQPLAVGQSVLLLVEVNLHEKFGFGLTIQDIDPSFTLGELEAQLNQLRQQLIKEKLYDLNRRFKLPKDFFRIAIIAPPNAAGLGDFRADADRLQKRGLCEFHYFYSSFQGDKVESEMLTAFEAVSSLHDAKPFDALAVIRGGGAKLDLTPLNNYALAEQIARADLPVLTGIGHERDNTILDEVAAVRFDTPSKVIAAIRHAIFEQAKQAQMNWLKIEKMSQRSIKKVQHQLVQLDQSIHRTSSQHIQHWRARVQPLEVEIKQRVMRHFSQSKSTVERHYQLLTSEAKSALNLKHQQLDQLNGLTKQGATHLVKQMGEKVQIAMQFIILPKSQKTLQTKRHAIEHNWQNMHNQTQKQLQKERHQIEQFKEVVIQQPLKVLAHQKKQIRQWIGFIYSSGPNNQLNRGFAIVKTLDGHPIKSAKEAQQQDSLVVNFKDGAVKTKVLPPITTSGEDKG